MTSNSAPAVLTPDEKRRMLARLLEKQSAPATAPLSFAQRRLWFLEQLEPGRRAYTLSTALRIGGALDVAALERALGELVRRHGSLRTTFHLAGGEPVQVIAPAGAWTLPVADLSAAADPEREARDRAAAHAGRPFDLRRGPLFRAALLRLAGDDHVLLMDLHHIVTDGWSMGVLHRELDALYTAFAAGAPSPLAPLPLQYADYAAWEREQLSGERLRRQLDFWTGRLRGAPALLELPTDHPRPAAQSYRGGRHAFAVPAPLAASLRALARAEGATLYAVLLSAWAVLLSRYARQADVVVGTSHANRPREELEGIIGFFVNTLALRTDLSGDPPFRALVRRTRDETLEAFAHAELPFERLVEELRVERTLAHTPVFQAEFVLQNTPGGGPRLGGLALRPFGAGAGGGVHFDLTLSMTEGTAGDIRGDLEYSGDLFHRATAARMAEGLCTLLRGAAADPSLPVSRLPLLEAPERHRLLVEWNRHEVALPADTSVQALFEAQVRRTPDAPALVHGARRRTYDQLNRAVNRAARALAAAGAGPEVTVALLAERGIPLWTATLGVVKSGAAFLPLDPAHPAARQRQVLAQSRAALVVVDPGCEGVLAEALEGMDVARRPAVLRLAEVLEGSGDESDPPVRVRPGNLAYVIFTSGSTGLPKGAMLEHGGMFNHLHAKILDLRITAADRVGQNATQCFDISIWQLVAPLLVGGACHVLADDVAHDPAALLRAVDGEGITILETVPSLMQLMVEELRRARPAPPLAALRWLIPNGEVLPPELCREWLEMYPRAALINAYGATEASDDVTHEHVPVPPGPEVRQMALGHHLANVRLYLLDGAMEPVPAGVPGQLWIGGIAVGRGYANDPRRTALSFVPDPFSADPGGRLYRTGDLVRMAGDGRLEFMGRVDHQVKVRGFRIELGEIEAVLHTHPGVRDAAVLVHDGRLAAYVAGSASTRELAAHLRASLPEYMVPGAWVRMEAMPLNANGKLDRRALPAPGAGDAPGAEGDDYAPPRTPAEEVLAGIWADVLGVERVGVHDGFFDLGGHSLLAIRVVARVRDLLGAELPVRALFEAPTVAGLAARLDAARAGGPPAPPPAPAPAGVEVPLSFAQQRLWFLDQLYPGTPLYNIPAARRFRGPLDAAALERALSEIVRRHAVLRTVFAPGAGGPVQRVLPAGEWRLRVEALSAPSPAELDAEVRRRAGDEARAPFDLARGPLFRARLLRVADDDHVLLWTQHHAVSDGWSLGVFWRELATLYAAYARGQASPLAEPALQYGDYAWWQRQTLAGEALDRQLAYWAGELRGAPALLELPTDRPRAAERAHRGATHGFALPAGVREAAAALARAEGATPYMVLLAAFAAFLSRYAGQDDVVVGTPVANRAHVGTEGMIGLFANTLALRVRLDGAPDFRALLRRVRQTTLGAFAHQDLPFEKLVEELQPERTLSHAPVFQAVFALQNAGPAALELPGVEASPVEAGTATAKVDLTLHVVDEAARSIGLLVYDTDLFDESTVRRMGAHFVRLLQAAVERPETPVALLPLLTAEEEVAGAARNATALAHPRARPLHVLFAEQAARTPDVPAAVYEGDTLTYAQLDARADALARRLRALGVGPEVRVAICMERSTEAMVALWGVLKAGGAYVPVDPSYPADRIAFMLRDCGAPVLLTQERVAPRLPSTGARVLCLDTLAGLDEAGGPPLPMTADVDHLAYVIYTSGSTGRPKGVQIQHRELLNYTRGFLGRLGDVPAGSTWAMVQPFSFDSVVTHVFATALTGSTLHLVSEERSIDAEGLAAYFARHPMDFLKIVPSHLAALLKGSHPAGVLPRRWLVIGGEGARPEWVRGIQALSPCQVFNHYGATETSVAMSMYRVPREGELPPLPTLPLGTPLPNTTLDVLDPAMNRVPAGVAGEIHIGGGCLARGYLNRPGLSAERFVPDPFAAIPGARLYRTGDRGRRLADGTVEFLGRVDHQVKLRGFRIEPGEVETALRALPGVREAVALLRTDGGEPRLVAYAVPADGARLDGAALRTGLRATLPEHVLPSAVVVLAELPRTSHGKLDRRALPAPEVEARAEYTAPRDEAEARLAEIWARVLGTERVGVHDDFFALGGHSLLATQLVSRIRTELGVELPLRALFEAPTVAGVAAALGRAPAAAARAPIPRRPRPGRPVTVPPVEQP